jgi:hypothetical protein
LTDSRSTLTLAPWPEARRLCTLRLALLLCVLVGLAGCSLRVSYPFMDWWLGWKVRDYISLDQTQQQRLESTLTQFQRWHQHTQLPLYAADLLALHKRLQQPQVLTPAELQTYSQQSEAHWLTSLDYVLPEVRAMFMTISPVQWQEFTQAVLERSEEELEPFLESTPEKASKLRQQRLEKSAKTWIGPLSEEQQHLIVDWSEAMTDLAVIRRLEQQRWIEQANQLYQQRHTLSEAAVQAQLRRLMAEESSFWLPEHQRLREDNRQRSRQLVCELHASLSDKQKRHLLRRLHDIHRDLVFLFQKTL